MAAVYTSWSSVLTDKAMRVLAFMANTTRDDDATPTFWGGRDMLVEVALGRSLPTPDRDDAEAAKVRRAAYKALADAIAHLKAVGAIVPANRPSPGRQAEYLVITQRPTVHVERVVNGPDPWAPRVASVHDERVDRYTMNVSSVHDERAIATRSSCTQGDMNTTNTTGNITLPKATTSLSGASDAHGCRGGWLIGADGDISATPCLICKPHFRKAAKTALRVVGDD